jgi:hypothetical protein
MKTDDIATVRKRKQMLVHEVVSSVVDQWLRDQVNRKTWEKNIASFPQGKVSLTHQKWMQLADDTTSVILPRYQVYGITLKLNPDKDYWQHKTFTTIGKKNPQLWVCCANYTQLWVCCANYTWVASSSET